MKASLGKCEKTLLQVSRMEQVILVPAHSCRMQNAGLVQSRDDPGKDTRAFRKGSIGQPVGTGQAETSTWVVNAEGITAQCCRQHWHP